MSRRRGIVERIKSNIKYVGRCWIWQGCTSGNGKTGYGYGRITIDGRTSAVHRVMYVCYHGYIGPHMQVDHICRNRLCCNPKHLEAVTAKENCRRRDEGSK